jgi:hypothetical protein
MSPPALTFVLYVELAKAGDQDILATLKGFLDDFKVASTALADAALVRSRRSKTDRVMASFGRVMEGTIYTGCGWVRAGTGILRDVHEKIGAKRLG